MRERPTWSPILEGTAAVAAREAIRAIARDVGDWRGAVRPADLAVFWAYVGAFDGEWASRFDEATLALVDAIATGYGRSGLFGGASGAGWALAHVSEGGADEILSAVDAAISQLLEVERWTADYDLIEGLVGYGVYFLERIAAGATSSARRGLARVVDHLLATSERAADGVTWFIAPELLPADQREDSPDGHYNCGLAHGVPGVIALLGRIAETGADPRAAAACDDALRWLVAQRLPPAPRGRFPAVVQRSKASAPGRSAWCYGDPGVAIAAFGAAARIGAPCEPWIELALDSAARPSELCGVVDAGLCHGAAGLAHLFNRLYQSTGDDRFRDAARAWFERALAMRRPEGIGGFQAWTTRRADEPPRWRSEAGLLEGAPGIALALLAAVEPVEPAWDRMFLCDLPAGQATRTGSS
jgi:lantibiotic biosynthesis protein